METVSVAVENAVLSPLWDVSAIAPFVPLDWSQARIVKAHWMVPPKPGLAWK